MVRVTDEIVVKGVDQASAVLDGVAKKSEKSFKEIVKEAHKAAEATKIAQSEFSKGSSELAGKIVTFEKIWSTITQSVRAFTSALIENGAKLDAAIGDPIDSIANRTRALNTTWEDFTGVLGRWVQNSAPVKGAISALTIAMRELAGEVDRRPQTTELNEAESPGDVRPGSAQEAAFLREHERAMSRKRELDRQAAAKARSEREKAEATEQKRIAEQRARSYNEMAQDADDDLQARQWKKTLEGLARKRAAEDKARQDKLDADKQAAADFFASIEAQGKDREARQRDRLAANDEEIREAEKKKQEADSALKDSQDKAMQAGRLIGAPLAEVFNAAIFNAKNFEQVVGQVLQNLAAQLISTGIISLFASLFSGGTLTFGGAFASLLGFRHGGVIGARQGYMIPGHGGGDRVPIMGERGELVVRKELAPAAIASGFGPGGNGGGGSIVINAPMTLSGGLPTSAQAQNHMRRVVKPALERAVGGRKAFRRAF